MGDRVSGGSRPGDLSPDLIQEENKSSIRLIMGVRFLFYAVKLNLELIYLKYSDRSTAKVKSPSPLDSTGCLHTNVASLNFFFFVFPC